MPLVFNDMAAFLYCTISIWIWHSCYMIRVRHEKFQKSCLKFWLVYPLSEIVSCTNTDTWSTYHVQCICLMGTSYQNHDFVCIHNSSNSHCQSLFRDLKIRATMSYQKFWNDSMEILNNIGLSKLKIPPQLLTYALVTWVKELWTVSSELLEWVYSNIGIWCPLLNQNLNLHKTFQLLG